MRHVTEIQTLLKDSKPNEIDEEILVPSTGFAQVPKAQVKATSSGNSVLIYNLDKPNSVLLVVLRQKHQVPPNKMTSEKIKSRSGHTGKCCSGFFLLGKECKLALFKRPKLHTALTSKGKNLLQKLVC